MKAAVLRGPHQLAVEEVPIPSPGPGEVLVRVEACGICGTDLRIQTADFPADYPVIPGHEFCGTIEEVGPDAGELQVGQRVAVNPNTPCRRCRWCYRGEPHLCRSMTACGVTYNGGFAQYCKVAAQLALPLPEGSDLPSDHWAMMEPISCCLHGIDVAQITAGDTVVILGGGSIGLLLMQIARHAGAGRLILSEPNDRKRGLAKSLGADEVVDPLELGDGLAEALREMTAGGADVVIEAAGLPVTAGQALKTARRGGTVLFFGVCPPNFELPLSPYEVYHSELTIRGTYTNPFTDSRALQLLASGRVQVGPIITHRFPLEQVAEGLDAVRRGDTVKALVIPS
jgi:2-desacetyl-2-hydroxyethyl bacteriochlorophyllide A dehydrogenase